VSRAVPVFTLGTCNGRSGIRTGYLTAQESAAGVERYPGVGRVLSSVGKKWSIMFIIYNQDGPEQQGAARTKTRYGLLSNAALTEKSQWAISMLEASSAVR
jgi:hypothetical protein